MKNLLTVAALTVLATTAFANVHGLIECKNITEASGQGYSAVLAPKMALVSNKNNVEAKLRLVRTIKGSDNQIATKIYSEKKSGGLTLTLSQAGVTGMLTATITRSGVAGSTVVADLNDCKK